jgi:hypothetical protein
MASLAAHYGHLPMWSAATEHAASIENCQVHLAQAVRYTALAQLEPQRLPDFNVVRTWPSERQYR